MGVGESAECDAGVLNGPRGQKYFAFVRHINCSLVSDHPDHPPSRGFKADEMRVGDHHQAFLYVAGVGASDNSLLGFTFGQPRRFDQQLYPVELIEGEEARTRARRLHRQRRFQVFDLFQFGVILFLTG